ncbi:MAG: hypothetical protein WCB61_07305, partial [Pseudolabrys sp.]
IDNRSFNYWRGHDDVMQICSGDSESPFESTHFQVHANDWDPIRAEHQDQRLYTCRINRPDT